MGLGQGARTDLMQPRDNITTLRGTSDSYLIGRLKRDSPDIAAALGRGEYRSVRAAPHLVGSRSGARLPWFDQGGTRQ